MLDKEAGPLTGEEIMISERFPLRMRYWYSKSGTCSRVMTGFRLLTARLTSPTSFKGDLDLEMKGDKFPPILEDRISIRRKKVGRLGL